MGDSEKCILRNRNIDHKSWFQTIKGLLLKDKGGKAYENLWLIEWLSKLEHEVQKQDPDASVLACQLATTSSIYHVRFVNVKVYDPGQGYHGAILAHFKGLKVTGSMPKYCTLHSSCVFEINQI